jgi:uncharacterized protein (TIGR02598 family)
MESPFVSCSRGRRLFRRNEAAFTLVEVVLSLGIFSFALLSVLGLMATGLSTVKNSSTNQAITNVNRELRATLQATPFTNLVIGTPATYYFTASGYITTASGTAANAPFYTAVMAPAAPTYPAGGTSANAFSVSVSIAYPYPANSQFVTNSYFVAQ